MLQRALTGNTGAHSAVEMALLDLAGRAANTRLIDLVARPLRTRVAPMWLLGNATPEQDIAEAKAKQAQGFDFFKLKIGVKPHRCRDRGRACDPRGAACTRRCAPTPIAG